MFSFDTKLRVRYNETDRMGYLHHGVYPIYLEIARTEMLRSLGLSYRELEDTGIMLPVFSLTLNYKSPAYYDDELTVISIMNMLPVIKLIIEYNVVNHANQLICTATSTNVFINAHNRKPMRAPEPFLSKFAGFFD